MDTLAAGLQGSKPRLKVVVSGLARENLEAAQVLVFSTMFICEMFGVVLVAAGRRADVTRITKASD